jgi:hypothetical protein
LNWIGIVGVLAAYSIMADPRASAFEYFNVAGAYDTVVDHWSGNGRRLVMMQ